MPRRNGNGARRNGANSRNIFREVVRGQHTINDADLEFALTVAQLTPSLSGNRQVIPKRCRIQFLPTLQNTSTADAEGVQVQAAAVDYLGTDSTDYPLRYKMLSNINPVTQVLNWDRMAKSAPGIKGVVRADRNVTILRVRFAPFTLTNPRKVDMNILMDWELLPDSDVQVYNNFQEPAEAPKQFTTKAPLPPVSIQRR